jgi:hypothetical protein
MTHGYYVGKAQRAMIDAGGDPDASSELAAWAEAQMAKAAVDRPHGAVVAQDGRVLAETAHTEGATYVTRAGTSQYGLRGNELGLAVSQIERQEGCPVVHVKLSQFTGRRECEEALVRSKEGADARRYLREHVHEMVPTWYSEAELARRAGVDRMTVRNWLGKR